MSLPEDTWRRAWKDPMETFKYDESINVEKGKRNLF
jgi:hypothetical protein